MRIPDDRINDRINEVKEHFPEPNCYLMALMLVSHFSYASPEIWYNHDHCITFIDGRFWDKNGQVSFEDTKMYLPITAYTIEQEKSLIRAIIEKHGKED